MSTIVLKTIFKLKRAKAATWTSKNPVLQEGEPGFVTDQNKLKIGDGTTAWNSLPYIAGDGSLPTAITDPENGQILVYNSTDQTWHNADLADNNEFSYTTDGGLTIKGYATAADGYMLTKDATNGVAWIKPVTTTELDVKVAEAATSATAAASSATSASTSATTAGNSATVAGNYATQAIQAAAQVEAKFWYGTMEEYNALEEVLASTIYIILDE